MLSLVIPFFNESSTVVSVARDLIEALSRASIAHEVILVDNGSHDDTGRYVAEVVRSTPSARQVVVPRNRGYGWGVREGLRQARGDVVGFMVGDGQVKPETVVRAYRELMQRPLAVCKAHRVVRHDGWRREALAWIGQRVFQWCFPFLKTHDINGSPKLFTRTVYEQLQLTSTDWFVDAELILKATLAGFAIGEVAVESPPRQRGRSNVRWTTTVEFLRNLVRFRWGGALTQAPARSGLPDHVAVRSSSYP